ncbi:uncharacterized protein AB9X84_016136 [Acanthopagrus schlegelii]
MADNTVKVPLGLVLIVAAHMVSNVSGHEVVTGILGTSIWLQFKFNVSITENSQLINVYEGKVPNGQQKVDEYNTEKVETKHRFEFGPDNYSIIWFLTNLTLNMSGCYWATVITDGTTESNKVKLIVREDNSSSTVSPMPSDSPATTGNSSNTHFVTVLVVSPVVLLAAVLPCLIWCLVRTKDKQEPPSLPPGHGSNSTVQETFDDSKNVPASSLVYSVLDFPKRPSAVLEINPSDTEYAAVSYITENRQFGHTDGCKPTGLPRFK